MQLIPLISLLLSKVDIFLIDLLLVLLLSLLMNAKIQLEYFGLFLKCLHLSVHRVPQPNLHPSKTETKITQKAKLKQTTYIVKLCIAFVADNVGDWVQSGDLALVLGAFGADRVSTAFADDFFVAKSKDVHETESTLAK